MQHSAEVQAVLYRFRGKGRKHSIVVVALGICKKRGIPFQKVVGVGVGRLMSACIIVVEDFRNLATAFYLVSAPRAYSLATGVRKGTVGAYGGVSVGIVCKRFFFHL